MGFGINVYDWVKIRIPLAVVLFTTYWVVLNLVFPPDRKQFPPYVDLVASKSLLGPITRKEWIALAGLGTALFLWLVPPVLKQVGLGGPVMTYLDKVTYLYLVPVYPSILYFLVPADRGSRPLLDWKDAQEDIRWGVILLIAGALSFSSLLSDPALGLGAFL